MRKHLLVILLLCNFVALAQKHQTPVHKFQLPKNLSAKDYLPNTIIVKFKPLAISNGKQLQSVVGKSLAVNGATILSLKSLFPAAKRSFSNDVSALAPSVDLSQIYELKYAGGTSIEAVINSILTNNDVAYAEPSYVYHTSYTPNDTYYNLQNPLAKVKAPQAWDVIRNASGVTIAIVDSGSDLQHEDLAANIAVNVADPVNGIDDDGDGYIDNYYGWDLIGASATTMIPDNDPDVKSDSADHGVHVSGIAGAVSDNNKGVASIAFNAKLLIVKVGADDEARAIYKGYEGIKYAADHGATIINCSWGGEGGGQYGQDMVNYALSKGCLVVAAAGNDGKSEAIYPAAYNGVLAVASVEQNDQKAGYSNYFAQVGISAPGSGVYNTTNGNTYGVKSGTSMASPLVASATALVKAKYPQYNGRQIGELLRQTSDPIDQLNSAYVGKLGKGRLNVYRAVTESPSAVKFQKFTVSDQSNGSRAAGTDISINLDLTNYLSPVNGLQVNLSTASPYAQITNGNINVGNVGTLQTVTAVGPFTVHIANNTPQNQSILFKLNYTGNGANYADAEYFEINVALDYFNVTVNQIATTVTSNGRLGFSQAQAVNGLGFIYKEESMLYEASFMVAKSPTQVSNNARSNGGDSAEDFVKQAPVKMITEGNALFAAESNFTDGGSQNPIGLAVKSKLLAYGASDDKYVIVTYDISNNSKNNLPGIYAGLFADWDLNESDHNATAYDETLRLAYVYDKKIPNFPYAGVKVLSVNALPAYFPMSNEVSGSFTADNNFTLDEKFQSLSQGIHQKALGEDATNGYDVMYTIGAGPYNIPIGHKIRVSFAFLAGDNLDDLKAQAVLAQQKYETISSEDITPTTPAVAALKQNYPNPSDNVTTIPFELPEKSAVTLSISDSQGKIKEVVLNEKSLEAGSYNIPINLAKYGAGVYFYQLKTNKFKKGLKMIVLK